MTFAFKYYLFNKFSKNVLIASCEQCKLVLTNNCFFPTHLRLDGRYHLPERRWKEICLLSTLNQGTGLEPKLGHSALSHGVLNADWDIKGEKEQLETNHPSWWLLLTKQFLLWPWACSPFYCPGALGYCLFLLPLFSLSLSFFIICSQACDSPMFFSKITYSMFSSLTGNKSSSYCMGFLGTRAGSSSYF